MKIITRHIIPILLILTAFGGFFRFYHLGSAPYWMDEGFTVNATLAIQQHGDQILDSGFSYTCPLYCFPSAWFAKLFGSTPFSYRLLAALAGTAFILVLFFIVQKMFNTRVALFSSFFASFSYFQIAWSRQARWYTLFELFFWLSLFAFYKAYYEEKGRKWWIGLTILFTLIASQSHELGYLLPLIFVGWAVIDSVIQKRISWKVLAVLGMVGIAAGVFIIKKFGIDVSYLFPLYLDFYFQSYWLLILLSILALFHPFNVWKKETRYLLFVLFCYVIPLSFFTDIINYRYLFHVTPVFFILGAIGTEAIISDIKARWMQVTMGIIVVLLFFVTGEGAWRLQTTYFLEADSGQHFFIPQPNWNAAYAFIKQNKKEGDQVVTTQPPFNKIFLGEPGYWIRYSYNGKNYMQEKDDKEFYVGATIINNVAEFQALTSSSHGYVVLDYYAEGLIPRDILQYIKSDLTLVFHETTNSYSSVSVYQF